MKNLILFVFITASFGLKAQNERYVQLMTDNIKMIDTSHTSEQFLQALNSFERIANASQDNWLPWYYVSYCNAMTGLFTEKKKEKDIYYQKAMEIIESKIAPLPHDSSEVGCLKAMILQIAIEINPAKRGQKNGMESARQIQLALKHNPNNPRAYLLRGESLFYTPKMFGGDKVKACEAFHTAKEKFDQSKETDFLLPHWGEWRIGQLLEECAQMK